MVADVARRDGAKDGVGQGVEAGVRVGVADQRLIVRHLDPAQPDGPARSPTVHVVAGADAGLITLRLGQQSFGHGEILGIGQFHQTCVALNQNHRAAVAQDDDGFVGRDLDVRPGVIGGFDHVSTEGLRRLGAPQTVAINHVGHDVRLSTSQAVGDGQDGQGAVESFKGQQQTIDDGAIQQRAGGVMDQYRLICRTGQGRKPGANRIGAGGSTDDGFPTRQTGHHLRHTFNGVRRDHDDQFVGAGGQQSLGRPAQHGLST